MQAVGTSRPHSAARFAEPDRVPPRRRVRGGSRAHDDATSVRAVIVSSLFLVLFTTGLLFGGHAVINPLLRMAAVTRNSGEVGDVVVPMPDGQYCRRMSFDNATAELIEGTIERCPDNIVGSPVRRTGRGFSWGEH